MIAEKFYYAVMVTVLINIEEKVFAYMLKLQYSAFVKNITRKRTK